jgi:hypothetical protein
MHVRPIGNIGRIRGKIFVERITWKIRECRFQLLSLTAIVT